MRDFHRFNPNFLFERIKCTFFELKMRLCTFFELKMRPCTNLRRIDIEGKWGGKTAGMEGVRKKNERPRKGSASEYY